MRKKVIAALIVAVTFSLTYFCYAQSARNPERNLEGKTNFTSIGLTGLDSQGNPGYIEMKDSGAGQTGHNTAEGSFGDIKTTWYLWIDNTGDLMIASYGTLSPYASFPTGDWQRMNNLGTVVGTQS